MITTSHARIQMQRRAIPLEDAEVILEFGAYFNSSAGSAHVLITKKERKKWIDFYKKLIQCLERTENKALLVSGEGRLLQLSIDINGFKNNFRN